MLDGLNLRPVERRDAPALQVACWPELPLVEVESLLDRLFARHDRGHAWGLVADLRGWVVGFGQLSRWGRRCEIGDLIVSEQVRGQGIGTALMQALLAIAHQQGFREVEIGAAESNPRALALYRRLGFRPHKHTMIDLGNGPEPVIYLSLNLAGQGLI